MKLSMFPKPQHRQTELEKLVKRQQELNKAYVRGRLDKETYKRRLSSVERDLADLTR